MSTLVKVFTVDNTYVEFKRNTLENTSSVAKYWLINPNTLFTEEQLLVIRYALEYGVFPYKMIGFMISDFNGVEPEDIHIVYGFPDGFDPITSSEEEYDRLSQMPYFLGKDNILYALKHNKWEAPVPRQLWDEIIDIGGNFPIYFRHIHHYFSVPSVYESQIEEESEMNSIFSIPEVHYEDDEDDFNLYDYEEEDHKSDISDSPLIDFCISNKWNLNDIYFGILNIHNNANFSFFPY